MPFKGKGNYVPLGPLLGPLLYLLKKIKEGSKGNVVPFKGGIIRKLRFLI